MTGISDAEGAAAVETVRRLRRQEHSRTRGLYETVFPEDSQRFVDYYYERVAKENEIYVVEDEEEIRAMLHLNPYPVLSVRFRVSAALYCGGGDASRVPAQGNDAAPPWPGPGDDV